MGFLDTAKITAVDILRQAYEYMKEQYAMSDAVFTPASPTGQILSVVSNISELIFVYLEHAASELNIDRAQTAESIHGLSRLTGHDPYRGCAASGIMRLKVNPAKMRGGSVRILDETAFVLEETGVQYFLDIGREYIVLTPDGEPVSVEFVQGVRNRQVFTGSGGVLQSYNVNERGMTDHDRVSVSVNGEKWRKTESLYDMGLDEKCFMCKSSVNMGLTVFFGNGDFGKCPGEGERIEVTYVTHTGLAGNSGGSNAVYSFTSAGYGDDGQTVDLNEVLEVETELAPCMGAGYEPVELTRRLAPMESKSFVLATPDNYVAFLGKYSQFASVDAYNTKDDRYVDDDNVVYLRILPNIKAKVSRSGGADYFALPLEEFTLNEEEKRGVIRALDDSGRQMISTEVVINDVKIRKYAVVVALRWFDGGDKNRIRNDIRSRLNTYFLNINRCDVIPKSDIVSIIEGVDGVDGVNVYFVSADNEEAVRNGWYMEEYDMIDPYTHLHERFSKRVVLQEGEDPMLGLDAFGDIKIGKDEIAVIRGGWEDRNGNEFADGVSDAGLCGLTIIFSSRTDDTLYNATQQAALNKILKGL